MHRSHKNVLAVKNFITQKLYPNLNPKNILPKLKLMWQYICRFIRVQRPITILLGPTHKRSRKFIEIDITYECNMGCPNCDRSCGQAPSNERMTLDQIKKFVQESIENNVKWDMIHLSGGEPTLHPDIFKIFDVINEYRKFNPSMQVHLLTNGAGDRTKYVLSKTPSWIKICNSAKESPVQLFVPFNLAPKDRALYKYVDYSNACGLATCAGLGLNLHGYYTCVSAGGIDRVFGFDIGRKKLPKPGDDMVDQLCTFCRFCGHFNKWCMVKKPMVSPTWKAAFEQYKKAPPKLSLY